MRITAILLVGFGALGMAALDVWGFELYGLSLFLGIPAAIGFVSVVAICSDETSGAGAALISIVALTASAFIMVAVGFEGVICLFMAAPLAIPVAIVGGLIGLAIVRAANDRRLPIVLTTLLLPLLSGAESITAPEAPMFQVSTDIIIEAPIDRVWDSVLGFEPLPDPDEWVFRAGVAYPMRAEIIGSGVGAVRHCVFSTGSFVEPITVWDEPHHLAFDVTHNPPPMRELSPYDSIPAPHLTDHLVARRGEFRLEAIDHDTTRLIGTTWYQHHLWPARYWRLWSDHIIHTIHRRVLEHIRMSAESAPPAVTPTQGATP